jgi:hypothetical protein
MKENKGGGYHTAVVIGEAIFIEHGGEKIELYVRRIKSRVKVEITFIGSKNFVIKKEPK